MRKLINKIFLIFVGLLVLASCTEEYTAGIENYENDLVVEATITNVLKKQKVKLSHTSNFVNDTVILEKNASVQVVENNSTVYDFTYKASDSAYFSNETFQVLPDKEYQLKIKTANGPTYLSEPQTLPAESEVDIVVKAGTSENEEGLRIEANSYDPTGNSRFYRYEYIETYQVTLPEYGPNKAVYVGFESLEIQPRLDTFPVCYNNIKSKNLLLKSTTELSEDRVSNMLVAFRSRRDYAIAEKYSILVKQYVESPEAYAYYNTLNKISSTNGNDFSAIQPGFVKGNIFAENNPDIKVVGYFDVASISTKRIFTKFIDFFSFGSYPPYFEDCDDESLDPTDWDFKNYPGAPYPEARIIKGYLEDGTKVFYKLDGNINSATYVMVKNICGSCDRFSTHVKPDFWE